MSNKPLSVPAIGSSSFIIKAGRRVGLDCPSESLRNIHQTGQRNVHKTGDGPVSEMSASMQLLKRAGHSFSAARVSLAKVRLSKCVLEGLCLLPFFVASISFSGKAWADSGLLQLQTGEVRVLAVPDVARVAVGDGQVINAVTTDEKEVIVFARKEGSSNLQIWSSDGVRRRYHIEVAPEGSRRMQQELRDVLERIPNAQVSAVGDKLLVEGDELGDDDRERIAELSRRYPQLLDFTSQVGWDRMVLLDVKVVEVPRNQLQELGVRWSPQSAGGLTTGLAWESGSRRLLDRPAVGQEMAPMPLLYPSGAAAAYFGINALLSAQINAMAQSGSAVILAQPQLLARSGSTAEFLAGGEVPYSTVDSNGNSSTSFKPYGVSLRITPKIERNNTLRSRIEVEVSSIDAALSVPNGPSLKTRRASTEFNVRSGQTLVLAGFLSREESRNVHKVPGLGDLPLLGRLFSSTRYQNAETELAIFVTPVVVTADHPDLLERVARGEEILESTFKNPEVLNVPVNLPLQATGQPDRRQLGASSQPAVQQFPLDSPLPVAVSGPTGKPKDAALTGAQEQVVKLGSDGLLDGVSRSDKSVVLQMEAYPIESSSQNPTHFHELPRASRRLLKPGGEQYPDPRDLDGSQWVQKQANGAP